MNCISITYLRDFYTYGEHSLARQNKLYNVLRKQGSLQINSATSYTFTTSLSPSLVTEYAKPYLEPDCSFIAANDIETSELLSGSYYC
ncbi:hypothetical protein [Paenibacillus sp. ISL-20]|uniref:hypothetical protein n=1 Tax=Paenibacillus sp. ISL-20 TaxID=2819163 RepID=UPI001BE8D408|nr:hypothetical protein [Paenibacillus sp. ISL-20]MBT2759996.1 hypothetical protein [Paenibacillus sp. ISL-20]